MVDTGLEILKSAARTFWVAAYADAVDRYFDEYGKKASLPMAVMGADWFDVAPKTQIGAVLAALQLESEFLYLNRTGLEDAYRKAELDVAGEEHRKEPTPREFGYCLAMEAMGHGVSWRDNHPDHGYEVPYIEYTCDVADDGQSLVENYFFELPGRRSFHDNPDAEGALRRWVHAVSFQDVIVRTVDLARNTFWTGHADKHLAEAIQASVSALDDLWRAHHGFRARKILELMHKEEC